MGFGNILGIGMNGWSRGWIECEREWVGMDGAEIDEGGGGDGRDESGFMIVGVLLWLGIWGAGAFMA